MSNGQIDDNNIGATLRTEGMELKTGVYVLNEELIPSLLEDNLNFCQETGPSYNKDIYNRHLKVTGNPDFPEGININISSTESMPVSEAHSLYRMTLLQEPQLKKYIRIDYIKVNPAYIFPKGEEEKHMSAKEIEIRRYNSEWGETNPTYSAFDAENNELTMLEMVKFGYDGYNYEFKKMVNRKGDIKIFFEMGQYNKEKKINKVLRKSNEMSNMKTEDFDNLRDTAFKATEKAKKISGASKE